MMRQVRQTTSGVGVAIVTLIFVLLLAVLVVLSNRILSVGPDGASLGRPLTVVLAVGLPVILLAVILFQVARLWHQRSTGQPGARLKTRLVLFFALVTVLTAIPVSLVSINFINSGVRLWLESDVGDALRGGESISLQYYQTSVQALEDFATSEAFSDIAAGAVADPQRLWEQIDQLNPTIGFLQVWPPQGPSQFLGDEMARLSDADVLFRSPGALPRDARGTISILRYGVTLPTADGPAYLVVGTVLPQEFDARANALTRALATVTQLDRFQDLFRVVLVGFYLAFSLPILLVAILLSFLISDELILPVVNLVEATRRVAEGDFSFRVLTRQEDELAVLVSSFNQMISELERTRRKIAQAEKIAAWQDIAQRLAHEIKNPLTPIKLSAERIARTYREQPDQLDEVVTTAVRTITREVDHLDRMLAEFREFARLPEPVSRPTELRPLLQEVVDLYRSSSGRAALRMEEVPDGVLLQLDAAQMKRAFGNLVSNSLGAVSKRGTDGEVRIRADHVHKSGRELWRVQVRDNGVGISEEARPHVFEPYFTTRPEGHGLGLAIVERIVFDHGGTIWFESEPGAATTFYVDLPDADAAGGGVDTAPAIGEARA